MILNRRAMLMIIVLGPKGLIALCVSSAPCAWNNTRTMLPHAGLHCTSCWCYSGSQSLQILVVGLCRSEGALLSEMLDGVNPALNLTQPFPHRLIS